MNDFAEGFSGPLAQRTDEERYGEYRTKQLITKPWERAGALIEGRK